MRGLLLIVLVLACPLIMILMMRGHRHGGHARGADDKPAHRERSPESTSTAELHLQRDALDRLIAERETVTPVAAGGAEHDGDRSSSRSVPVAWRQLRAEPAKLVVTLVAVAAAVALVLLLSGLRRGMGEQVTLYIDHQAPVLVGQQGPRDFLSQTSVLPEGLARDLERVPTAPRRCASCRLAKEEGTTVVIVSHDQRLREVADRVLWLEDGQLKTLEALVRDPVCGMHVDPAEAPASILENAATLYFCSRGCKQEYEEEQGVAA